MGVTVSTGTNTKEAAVATRGTSALISAKGKTTIADVVVSKIAGIATREVAGVYDVGGGAARVVGSLRERIPGARASRTQGVTVEVGERQAAVDVEIVAEYGTALADLAADIRRNVIDAVQRMTGLEVVEVNVTVHDIHFEEPGGEKEAVAPQPEREPRVQ